MSPGSIKTEGGKRPGDPAPTGAAKRRRVADEPADDVSERTVADIVATITDPNYMCGPDVGILLIIGI